jgi:hypothetical protein
MKQATLDALKELHLMVPAREEQLHFVCVARDADAEIVRDGEDRYWLGHSRTVNNGQILVEGPFATLRAAEESQTAFPFPTSDFLDKINSWPVVWYLACREAADEADGDPNAH